MSGGPSIGLLRTLANVLSAAHGVSTDDITLQGWRQIGQVWMQLIRLPGSESQSPGLPPIRQEQARAIIHRNSWIAAGHRLATSEGPAWRIRECQPDTPDRGWTTLLLERSR